MVYVPLSRSYEETINNARKVFSDLAHVKPDHIVLSLGVYMKETRATVHISPMAWTSVAATLHRYEVLNVEVDADRQDSDMDYSNEKIKIIVEDTDATSDLPSYSKDQYLTVPGMSPALVAESLRRSKSCEEYRPSSPDGKTSTHSEKIVKLSWFKRLYH